MNLSSIVIQTKPEFMQGLINIIKEADFCEYHLHDENGRIIVTVEGKDTGEEIAKLKLIKDLPNVTSAEMVFAYSEDELEAERQRLESTEDNIPDWLNNPKAKLGDIKYNGDLKKGV